MSISHRATTRAATAGAVAALPEPVARFVALAAPSGAGRIRTVVLDTVASMCRPGIPGIPLAIRMTHELGEAFVHDIRIGRPPLAFRFGLDAFVDGHGIVRIGRTAQSGERIDQGALIAMWGEALVFTDAWMARPDVWWEPVDEHAARLWVPGPAGPLALDVGFSSATGLPSTCRADRYKGDGPLTPWMGRWSHWRSGGRGVLIPRRMDVRWLDEPRPWLDIRVRRVLLDARVEPEFERVRVRAATTRHQAELEGNST
jgi:uncharacterized protein DUF6544